MQKPNVVFKLPPPLLRSIAKEQFQIALAKAKRQPSILSLCFEITTGDELSLISYFSKENIAFLYQSNQDATHLFAGHILAHQASGNASRFEEANTFFKSLKPLHSSNHKAYSLHLALAFNFEEKSKTPSLSCFVPQWHYFKNHEASFISFYYLIDTNCRLSHLEKEFSESLSCFQSIPKADPIPLPSLSFLQSTVETYPDTVCKALKILKTQEYQKITLAAYSDYKLKNALNALDLSSILAKMKADANPATTVFCFRKARGHNFFGATPETFLRSQNKTLFIDALAGSIPRQGSLLTDASEKAFLLKDPKTLEEHQLVIGAIVKALKGLSLQPLYPKRPQIRSLKHLHHLFTPIEASFDGSSSLFSVIEALHPTPALGTYPKSSNPSLIPSLEGFERELYGGGLGWINSHDDSHITVNIRCAKQEEDHLRFFAGCGLTAESSPPIEQEELKTKLKTLLNYFNCS